MKKDFNLLRIFWNTNMTTVTSWVTMADTLCPVPRATRLVTRNDGLWGEECSPPAWPPSEPTRYLTEYYLIPRDFNIWSYNEYVLGLSALQLFTHTYTYIHCLDVAITIPEGRSLRLSPILRSLLADNPPSPGKVGHTTGVYDPTLFEQWCGFFYVPQEPMLLVK